MRKRPFRIATVPKRRFSGCRNGVRMLQKAFRPLCFGKTEMRFFQNNDDIPGSAAGSAPDSGKPNPNVRHDLLHQKQHAFISDIQLICVTLHTQIR